MADAGRAVSRVESGHGAIQRLEHEGLDAIATDGNMDDGHGGHAAAVAPGRPMFRNAADARALTTVVREIVRPVRDEPAPF